MAILAFIGVGFGMFMLGVIVGFVVAAMAASK